MEIKDIIKLLDAGWSREEILQLSVPNPAQNPAPVDPIAPEPAPIMQPAVPIPAPAPAADHSAQLLAAVQQLTQTIQANAIMQSQQPPKPDVMTQAHEALAAIINPPQVVSGK